MGVIFLGVLTSCGAPPASTPESTAVQELAAPAEAPVDESAAASGTDIQAQSRLKEPAAAAAAVAAPELFSPEDASPFPPLDIIQEVGYFGGAEPGSCDQMSVDLKPLEVEACPADTVEQMGFLALLLTGLEAREVISLTITYPDDSQTSQQVIADRGGTIRYEFVPDLGQPTGEHLFSFQTLSGDFEKTISVMHPTRPHLYLLPEQRQLVMFNFTPEEVVRLFLYQQQPDSGLVMRSWKEFRVDSQGSLTVEYPALSEPYFYAVGETSGLVPYEEKGASDLRQLWPGGDIACPGAPKPLQLSFDDTVSVTAQRVVAEIDSYPDVFSFPIPRGTKLKLEYFWGAPRCENQMIWWTVECPRLPGLECRDFTRVWVPEGRGSNYYIQPASP